VLHRAADLAITTTLLDPQIALRLGQPFTSSAIRQRPARCWAGIQAAPNNLYRFTATCKPSSPGRADAASLLRSSSLQSSSPILASIRSLLAAQNQPDPSPH
jgi:hypothetical protein